MTPTPVDQPSRAEEYRSARKLDFDILARIVKIALHYPVRVAIAVSATVLSSMFQLFIPRYVGKAVDHAQGLLGRSGATPGEIEAALLIAGMMIIGLSFLRGAFAVYRIILASQSITVLRLSFGTGSIIAFNSSTCHFMTMPILET